MSCSLMKDQMIRVISSPSSSTTGLATLIFAMAAPYPGACDPVVRGIRAPMALPPVRSDHPVPARGTRLVAVDDLPPTGVCEVATEKHGPLGAGLAGGVRVAPGRSVRD